MIARLKIKQSYYLLPILVAYIVIVVLFGADVPLGDGIRYWAYAGNLLNGTYATPDVDMLHMGPGYPLILAVFRFLNSPLLFPLLLNAILLYLGVYYYYKTAILYITPKIVIISAYLLAFWDPFLLYWMQKLYSESLVVFLISFFSYHFILYFKTKNKKNFVLSGIAIGYLALTKVIFGYVIAVAILLSAIMYFIKNYKELANQSFKVFGLGLLLCLPYLGYTFSLTNKLFYWGNTGGELLYWTSSPYKTDLGEWHTGGPEMNDFFAERYEQFSGFDAEYVYQVNQVITDRIVNDHKSFKVELDGLNSFEADAHYKNEAFKNIKEQPLNFVKNWIMNIGRITLGYPHALYAKPPFSPFMSLLNIIKSSFLLVFFVVAVSLSFLIRKTLDKEVIFVLITSLIYFGGVSFLAAQSQRFLIPILPVLFFFIIYSINKTIKLKKT